MNNDSFYFLNLPNIIVYDKKLSFINYQLSSKNYDF